MTKLIHEVCIEDFRQLVYTGIPIEELSVANINYAIATLSQVNMTPFYLIVNTNGQSKFGIDLDLTAAFTHFEEYHEIVNSGVIGTYGVAPGLIVLTDAFLDLSHKFVKEEGLLFTFMKYHREGLIIPSNFPDPIGF